MNVGSIPTPATNLRRLCGMWKIFIVMLMACSDPTVKETNYEFEIKYSCEQGMIKFRPQFNLPPGSYLECRKVR